MPPDNAAPEGRASRTGTRRWIRRLVVVFGVLVVAGGSCTAWLLRDPLPWFRERRSSLVGVDTVGVERIGADQREQVRLLAASGLVVDLAIRRPDRGADTTARRPLFVILSGYEAGMAALEAIPDTRGYSIAVLDYPYQGPTDLKGLGVVPHVPAIRRAILDTPPAVMIALDYFMRRPDVDTTRIELVGASFGAPFAVIAAALDPRVARLWVLHGAADPYALFYHGLRDDIGFPPLRSLVAGLASILSAAPRLDPVRWIADVSPRPVVMINARDDERIPIEPVMELYEAAREPRSLHWLSGPHMQRNRPAVLAALVDTVLALADSLR